MCAGIGVRPTVDGMTLVRARLDDKPLVRERRDHESTRIFKRQRLQSKWPRSHTGRERHILHMYYVTINMQCSMWGDWACPLTCKVFWVFFGFLVAQVVGIPFGLAMAVNKNFRGLFFSPFEILRPIPPLAWVPASIIFWPTTELSIMFVTFLGAFYTVVINVLGGARSIDIQYLRAAQSMGATRWDLFRKIILPGTMPSIFIGAAVGMGITWEVVLAAEIISGGGQQSGGGLGFFIWSSYMGGVMDQVIVGMISIGLAGYISSSLIRYLGHISMPWRRMF